MPEPTRRVLSGFFLGVILIGLYCAGHSERYRMAFLPRWKNGVEALLCDGFVQGSRGAKDIRVFGIDETGRAFPPDSLSNDSFLLSRSRNLRLDELILFECLEEGPGSIRLHVTRVRPEQNEVLHDTLAWDLSDPESFEERIFSGIPAAVNAGLSLPQRTAWESYGSGRLALRSGRTRVAAEFFREGWRLDPSWIPGPHLMYGLLLEEALMERGNGNTVEEFTAAEWLKEALELDSLDSRVWLGIGRWYIQKENWGKAEEALRRAWESDPEDADLLFHLSRLHPSRFRYTRIRSKAGLLERTLRLNPAHERAWLALADIHYFQNNSRKAESVYKKMLAILPESIDGLLGLARLYTQRNDILNLISVYERLLSIYPNHPDAIYNLGVAYYNDGRNQDAERLFQRAVQSPDHVDGHLYLGVIAMNRGEKNRAIGHFRERLLRKGKNDFYAEEARRHLETLLNDSASLKSSGGAHR